MFVIQDPTNEQSTYLLESLIDAFRGAESIVGAFAFVSSSGVRLLTDTEEFQEVAHNHTVELVVGIDAVTNERALDSLTGVAARFPNFRVRAFLNPQPGTIFHPKFCWTKKQNGSGHLVVGSGNLTESGLLGNWEAYTVEELRRAGISQVADTWNAWTTRHAASLLPLDHAEVRRRAQTNKITAVEGDLPTLIAPPVAVEEPEPLVMPNTAGVLIAEIPNNNNRWKQANFHRADYVEFFGVQEGTARLFVFRHVGPDGTRGEYEQDRPPVTVSSRNFRFELGAAAGIPYPTNGRPIGVFIRMAAFAFFYRLLLPDDQEFRRVYDILERREGPPVTITQRDDRTKRIMRSTRMTVAELRAEWPTSPFWQLPAIT